MSTLTILSKQYGTQKINLETFAPHMAATSSTVFQIVEHMFNEWFAHNTQPGAPKGRDIVGMYEGECDQPPIYSKKGAIRQGIENLIEEVKESGRQLITTKDILKMDIESAFI